MTMDDHPFLDRARDAIADLRRVEAHLAAQEDGVARKRARLAAEIHDLQTALRLYREVTTDDGSAT